MLDYMDYSPWYALDDKSSRIIDIVCYLFPYKRYLFWFLTRTFRNACSVLLYCSVNLISVCKLFRILCSVSKSLKEILSTG